LGVGLAVGVSGGGCCVVVADGSGIKSDRCQEGGGKGDFGEGGGCVFHGVGCWVLGG